MSDWHKAAEPGELADGAVKAVEAGGCAIALVRQGDLYHALEDRCTHMGAPLSQGAVEDGMLVCPWHGREFCVKDGSCPSAQGVRTFPVEVRADGIFVAA